MALGEDEAENDDYYYDQLPDHVTERVHIDDIIELCDKLIIGLEQKDYVSDLKILNVYTLRDKIKRQPYLLKQFTLDEVFKRQQKKYIYQPL